MGKYQPSSHQVGNHDADLPPRIGGNGLFKIKDVKAAIARYEKEHNIAKHSWHGVKRAIAAPLIEPTPI